jgi:hypothetical protein
VFLVRYEYSSRMRVGHAIREVQYHNAEASKNSLFNLPVVLIPQLLPSLPSLDLLHVIRRHPFPSQCPSPTPYLTKRSTNR